MNDDSLAPANNQGSPAPPPSQPTPVYIHRVCVQCNNMFRVTADKFDAKQCPNCHKS